MTSDIPLGDVPGLSVPDGVRYEVAEDIFADLIGWCATQIAQEKSRLQPDAARLQGWADEAAGYVAQRKALNPQDAAGVAAVVARYAPVVRLRYPGRRTGLQ